ncbi:MAG TPA: alkaline phosphatase family protein [Ktedonobacteraceae bacterium]|nr:alkaline phosphatase family protein [Ktedonobacteraceae bacterium]
MSISNPFGVTIASRATPLKQVDPLALQSAVKCGLGWVRLQVQWNHIELTKGVYDPNALSVIDNCVSFCNQHGLRVQFPIQAPPTFHLSSTSMGQGPNGPWYAWDAQATAKFASDLASRYNGTSGHGYIDSFEIGNEDFSSAYLPGAPVTPQGQAARDPKWFLPILEACAPVIRQNSPHALIGMGALWWENSEYQKYFMSALYAANVGNLFDYANIHFYSGSVPPDKDTSPTRLSLPGQILNVWNVMNANGDGAKQVAVTEFGWRVPGDVPDEATRQSFYQKAFDSAIATGHVGIMNLYTLKDIAESVDPNVYQFSLIHVDANNQPVYTPSWNTVTSIVAKYTGGNNLPPPPPSSQPIIVNLNSFTGSLTFAPPLATADTLNNYTGVATFTPASSPVPPPPVPVPPPPSSAPHVAVILMENRSYDDIFGAGKANFPQVNALAAQYAYATNYYGVGHPSLPNYLALLSGSSQGVTSDGTPQAVGGPFAGPTLVDELASAGISWRAYFEGMPNAGYTGGDTSGYAQHHNPFIYYSSVIGSKSQLDNIVPADGFAADLASGDAPAFLWYVPNMQDDGHNSSGTVPDTWLGNFIGQVQQSAWYAVGGTILVVWDEGAKTDTAGIGDGQPGGGRTGLLAISEAVKGVGAYTTPLNCYGLLKSLLTCYSVPLIGKTGESSNGEIDSLLGVKA